MNAAKLAAGHLGIQVGNAKLRTDSTTCIMSITKRPAWVPLILLASSRIGLWLILYTQLLSSWNCCCYFIEGLDHCRYWQPVSHSGSKFHARARPFVHHPDCTNCSCAENRSAVLLDIYYLHSWRWTVGLLHCWTASRTHGQPTGSQRSARHQENLRPNGRPASEAKTTQNIRIKNAHAKWKHRL